MNERIKQLAEQADSYAISMEKETGAFYFDSYNEKFAELIVQECCVIADRLDRANPHRVSRVIKETFWS